MSWEFYSYHLYSSSSIFNLCSCWNINDWNSGKRDSVMYLNSVFKPVCICLRKLVKVRFLSLKGTLLLFLISILFSFVLIPKSLEWEVFIYRYSQFLLLYCWKMPTTITLYQLAWCRFGIKKYSIGNIYFPQYGQSLNQIPGI